MLRKRENYRKAMDGFDPEKIARYDDAKIAALLQDTGLIRNRLKMGAAVGNARAYLDLRDAGTSLDIHGLILNNRCSKRDASI